MYYAKYYASMHAFVGLATSRKYLSLTASPNVVVMLFKYPSVAEYRGTE